MNINPLKKPTPENPLAVWTLAGELGLLLSVPLIIAVPLGVTLDRSFGTTPLFIIIGLVLAFLTSSLAVIRKIKALG